MLEVRKIFNKTFYRIIWLYFLLLSIFVNIIADEFDQYKVKREEKFEFDVKPTATKQENSYLISFTTKNYCDVSICVVNNEDKILRHIASGVLGDNAPAPLAKNSLKQEIKWDLKDDQGNYLKNLDNIKIQVALGLKPEFERTLYWDPQKKLSYETPVIKATKEGVLVYNGAGVDHLVMYTHDGIYSKTIYPYQRDNLKNISDMLWQEFPQAGKVPKKYSFLMQTLLTSGNNAPDIMNIAEKDFAMHGTAATTIGVLGNKVALIKKSINRMSLHTGEEAFKKSGPIVTNFTAVNPNTPFYGPPLGEIYPKSVAFSPDGKWLYMSGYYHNIGDPSGADYNCLHGVTRVAYDKQEPFEIFLGKMSVKTDRYNNMKDAGDDNEHFSCATSVACDKEGRIYVSDYMNQRIQVFTPEGKFLKSIKTEYPSKVVIHPDTNEIYVISWLIRNPKISFELLRNFKPCLMIYGSFDNPVLKDKYEMPFLKSGSIAGTKGSLEGSSVQAELDLWSDQPKLWVSTAVGIFYNFDKKESNSDGVGICIYQLKNNKWEIQTKFEDNIKTNLGAVKNPNGFPQVQNLYVNQQTGLLYIGEPDTVQNFSSLVEVNPISGKCKTISLPFQTVDMGFDLNGLIYLRKVDIVGRYDLTNWREVPFDYGIEADFIDEKSGKKVSLVSSLAIPSILTNQTFHGGMSISSIGNIAISCLNYSGDSINPIGKVSNLKYKPPLFPGKLSAESIHIWDKHGKKVAEDAVSGLGRVDGVWLDGSNNLFVMSVYHRILSNKISMNKLSSTIIKFSDKKGRVISNSKRQDQVPLTYPAGSDPERTPELFGVGNIWVSDSEWLYGGVGYSGKHLGGDAPMGCCCWHGNFALDLYGRSFAAEVDQYDVAVLDTNGNLILKIGKYGNLDDGIPLIKEGGAPNPRSIGGDEVGLFHAAFVATHSDKRVFIADYGNGRVVSVKLNYHNSVKLEIK